MPEVPVDAVGAAHFSHFFASSKSWPFVVCNHTPAAGELIWFFWVVLKQQKNSSSRATGDVKHMYISGIPRARPLLSGHSVGRHSPTPWLPVPDALLCYAENAQVAETPPSTELWAEEREEKISRAFFFSAYETNAWHSTEHCSAVGLSVNRRQYARARWQPIQLSLPRKFKSKEKPCTSPLLLLSRPTVPMYSLSLSLSSATNS